MIDPSTRLRRAIHLSSLPLVQRILNHNPHLLRNPDFSDHAHTSLHLAATLGSVPITHHLLSLGHESDGPSRSTTGLTPLMLAASSDTPAATAVARLLLAHDPSCVWLQDGAGLDAFAHAARAGATALLGALLAASLPPPFLEQRASLVQGRDVVQNTPLHHASAAGQLKALRLLVGAGADAEVRNAARWSALDYSATVAAEVYLRGLVRERDAKVVGGTVGRERGGSDERRAGVRGGVRLVRSADEERFEFDV